MGKEDEKSDPPASNSDKKPAEKTAATEQASTAGTKKETTAKKLTARKGVKRATGTPAEPAATVVTSRDAGTPEALAVATVVTSAGAATSETEEKNVDSTPTPRKRKTAAKSAKRTRSQVIAPDVFHTPTRKALRSATKTSSVPSGKDSLQRAKKPAKKTAKNAVKAPPAKKKQSVKPKLSKKTGPTEVWSGSPDDNLGDGRKWPSGWCKKKFERHGGQTKGRLDCYWYTPQKGYKLRSLLEVKRFLDALKKCKGNEMNAKAAMK